MLTYWYKSVFSPQSKIAPTAIGSSCVNLESTLKKGNSCVSSTSSTWKKENEKKRMEKRKGKRGKKKDKQIFSDLSPVSVSFK